MTQAKSTVLLSPPNSPLMSDEDLKSGYQWQQAQSASFAAGQLGHLITPSTNSHEAVPRHLQYHQSAHSNLTFEPSNGSTENGNTNLISGKHLSDTDEKINPSGRLTPTSAGARSVETKLEDDDDDFNNSGDDQDAEGEDTTQMTAAELTAQKRKMKRFRLTHNQTRFLMSEFSKHPHPDAAHRERLSREIPGLSPRQVQVWFQNRRAKLKRLTTDDRERLTRTRAQLSNFDSVPSAQHNSHQPFTRPRGPSSGYQSYIEHDDIRPLSIDTFRRGSELDLYGGGYSNSTGISPAMNAFTFTPPRSNVDNLSPNSAVSNSSTFSPHDTDSPRRWGVPIQTGFGTQGSNIHDRLSRSLGDSAGSPLRTTMSYNGLGSHHGSNASPPGPLERSYSAHVSVTQERPQLQRSMTARAAPYGLGMSFGTGNPSPQMEQYRRASSHLAGPPIPGYSPSSYQHAQFSPSFSSSYGSQSYQSLYSPQEDDRSNAQPPIHQPFGTLPPQPFSSYIQSTSAQDRPGDSVTAAEITSSF